MKSNPVVAEVAITREPGHIYFVDKDGDVAKRRRNPGHYPKGTFDYPNIKVARLGIRKDPRLIYYLEGNKVRTAVKPQYRREK